MNCHTFSQSSRLFLKVLSKLNLMSKILCNLTIGIYRCTFVCTRYNRVDFFEKHYIHWHSIDLMSHFSHHQKSKWDESRIIKVISLTYLMMYLMDKFISVFDDTSMQLGIILFFEKNKITLEPIFWCIFTRIYYNRGVFCNMSFTNRKNAQTMLIFYVNRLSSSQKIFFIEKPLNHASFFLVQCC